MQFYSKAIKILQISGKQVMDAKIYTDLRNRHMAEVLI